MSTSCVMFPSEVMSASRVIRNTSHHCEHSEQHNYAKHNITLAQPNLHLIFDVAKIRSFEAKCIEANKTTIFSGVSMTVKS